MSPPKDFMVEITAREIDSGAEDFRMKLSTTLTCAADGEALRKALDVLLPLLPADPPQQTPGA